VWQAALAALAMALSLATGSLVKSFLLSRIVGEPINNWRWGLVWATIPAALVGALSHLLPEWAELLFGIPAIVTVYCLMIWRFGFGPEDRVLLRKQPA
jgi:hypothetical protein